MPAMVQAAGCGRPGMQMVRLDSGQISGSLESGVWSYLGVPYAAPPVGSLRWRPPQPVKPWNGVKVCTSFSPACPQPKSQLYNITDISEDCLYLNVWSPARSPDERLPVMVWIHGGSFNTGSGGVPAYDGSKLARRGVIVITFNYRLGPLGYLCYPGLDKESKHDVSGNYGMLDQVAAFEWVKKNAKAFGGDASRVTAFGKSAGAISVVEMIVSPLARGLFQRAISESGSFYNAFPVSRDTTLAAAEKTGQALAVTLGCDKASDVVAAMRKKTAKEIVDAAYPNGSAETAATGFMPVVDGWAIPADPSSLFAAGKQAKVPLLIGNNADEGTLFIATAGAFGLGVDGYQQYVRSIYGANADSVLATFPATKQSEVGGALDSLTTVMGFGAGARFAAASAAKTGSKAFQYNFTRKPDIQLVKVLGSFHGLELFYVFGDFVQQLADIRLNPADLALSKTMMGYWTNFARSGDPNGPGLPAWPAYDSQSNQYQQLGDQVAPGTGLYANTYSLVHAITGW